MANPGDYIIVHLVDKVDEAVGFRRKRLDWPLHITIVPWFSAPDFESLAAAIAAAAGKYTPHEVAMGGVEGFGPNGDVPVNVVANPEPLRELQMAIVDSIKAAGAVVDPRQRTGQDYRPHVTHHGEHHLQPGDIELIDDLHIVQVDADDMCTILRHFPLGRGTER